MNVLLLLILAVLLFGAPVVKLFLGGVTLLAFAVGAVFFVLFGLVLLLGSVNKNQGTRALFLFLLSLFLVQYLLQNARIVEALALMVAICLYSVWVGYGIVLENRKKRIHDEGG